MEPPHPPGWPRGRAAGESSPRGGRFDRCRRLVCCGLEVSVVRLRAVLWDVDGTLADTEFQGHRLAYNQAFQAAGLPWRWDPATYRDLLRVSGGRERLRHFFARVQPEPAAEALLDTLMAAKQSAYGELARRGDLPLRPGVKRLVMDVAAQGGLQALVTTSSRSAVAALLASHGDALADAFAFWVCGEDVGAKKPSPEGFQQALDRLKLPPSQVLVVEDSPQGLAAARGAGLACLLTLADPPEVLDGAWWRGATAAVNHLGEEGLPMRVLHGPPCEPPKINVLWLNRLLEAA